MSKSMSLRDMKRKVRAVAEPAMSTSQEKYPYGLRLNLGTEEIKKLDLNIEDLTVGDEVVVLAMATIVSVGKDERLEDGKVVDDRNCSIQIEELAIKQHEKATIKDLIKG